MPSKDEPCLKPPLKALPTEFPSDAALKIGQAILAKSFDRSLIEPIYDLVGYGLFVVFGGSGPFPKPTFGEGIEAHTDDEIGWMLVSGNNAQAYAATQGDPDPAKALPWKSILKVLAKIMIGILLAEPAPDADTGDFTPAA